MNATRKLCTVAGCTQAHKARGLCSMHYQRLNKRGDVGSGASERTRIKDAEEALRFKGWTVAASGCWEWKGTLSEGRGVVTIGGRRDYAYRVAFEVWSGPIPEGLFVCHDCDNPRCINPAHLFAGTHDDNVADMVSKDRSIHGTRNHYAVLEPDAVTQIRKLLSAGITQDAISRQFNVARTTVSAISTGRSWRRVQESAIVYRPGEPKELVLTVTEILSNS